ncbi:MAG: T9SS type B sorting domain-containing protein, partial [Nonlabens sp.]|nr:T9SS type B sorting domain-containing protein [Nonlabens sp.]
LLDGSEILSGSDPLNSCDPTFVSNDCVQGYFTPNNDGYHDTWSIPEAVSEIYIFDRFGKLVAIISPGKSWDGTYNGVLLNQTDYWYKTEVLNNFGVRMELKGHFSLVTRN